MNGLEKHGILLKSELRDVLIESARNHIKTTLKNAVDKIPFEERMKLLNSMDNIEQPKTPVGLEPIEEEPKNMLASSFHSLKEKILNRFKK